MIPISRPAFGPEEEAAVLAVMRSGQFAQGPEVAAFESEFASATGARFAVATSSGSTALLLALAAHGVGPGDEVITSPLTFIATANAIVQAGARPVFADVDNTLNLDPDSVLALIGPHTRAIVPVHLHGNPADMAAFGRLAAEYGLALIQDACQAVGATVGGRRLGELGTAVYSFYATKNLTTGEGGMVTTADESVASFCRSLRHQAYTSEPYLHDRVGWNFRMTELQAAIGRVQLRRLGEITERRQRIASYYDETITDAGLTRPGRVPGSTHVYHQYTLRLAGADGQARELRDRLRRRLASAGVGTGVYYPVPVHRQPAYEAWQREVRRPRAERAADDMVSIPVYHGLSDAEVELVARSVREVAAG